MKYRKQKYSSCQLIAAINARIHLGGGDISDAEFERLVDVVKCRHGGAICIEEAYRPLGLEVIDGPLPHYGYPWLKADECYDWIKENLPVELSVHSPKFGYHAILVVDTFVKHDFVFRYPSVRTINSDEGEITWSSLRKRFPRFPYQQRCRSFRLAESKASC
jgi:hypothetical protein